jgi:hypothetical protein
MKKIQPIRICGTQKRLWEKCKDISAYIKKQRYLK